MMLGTNYSLQTVLQVNFRQHQSIFFLLLCLDKLLQYFNLLFGLIAMYLSQYKYALYSQKPGQSHIGEGTIELKLVPVMP